MADQKITDLTAYTTPIDTDVLPIVDITTPQTKKISWASIKAKILNRQVFGDFIHSLTNLGSGFMDGSNELIYTDTIHGCYKFTIDDLLDYFGNIFIAVQWEIIPLYGQVANSSSYTPIVSGSQDIYLYAMLQATTFNNPAGTWYGGMRITIKLKDNGTARALTWGTKYQGTFVALPSTTIANKAMFLEFMYYLYDDKFELLRVLNQP